MVRWIAEGFLFQPVVVNDSVSLLRYGLVLWIPTLFKKSGFSLNMYQDSFLVAASNLPGNIVSSLVVDWLGRKHLLALSMAISGGLAILFAFSTSASYVVPIACLFNAVSGKVTCRSIDD